jgi:hypothetical protein
MSTMSAVRKRRAKGHMTGPLLGTTLRLCETLTKPSWPATCRCSMRKRRSPQCPGDTLRGGTRYLSMRPKQASEKKGLSDRQVCVCVCVCVCMCVCVYVCVAVAVARAHVRICRTQACRTSGLAGRPGARARLGVGLGATSREARAIIKKGGGRRPSRGTRYTSEPGAAIPCGPCMLHNITRDR